jgi:hypothetical protein
MPRDDDFTKPPDPVNSNILAHLRKTRMQNRKLHKIESKTENAPPTGAFDRPGSSRGMISIHPASPALSTIRPQVRPAPSARTSPA